MTRWPWQAPVGSDGRAGYRCVVASYRDRMDPGGRLGDLAAALGLLATEPILSVLRRLRWDPDTVEIARNAVAQYDALVTLPEQVSEYLAPLGWIAADAMPFDLYRAAAQLAQAGETNAAEDLLVEAWTDERLWLYLTRVSGLYRDDRDWQAIGTQRWRLMREAYDNHVDGRYGSAIALTVTQIDGIVFDMTGTDARSFFASGRKAAHLQDVSTLVGHPAGLTVLATMFNKDRKRTTVDGELRRHGIVHGRELGYDTKPNAIKTLVALIAVMEWAAPLAGNAAARRVETRHERWAGSDARDEYGHRRDDRGFPAAREALWEIHGYQHGHFTRRGRYATDLAELGLRKALVVLDATVLEIAPDRRSYRAWVTTPSGVVFGVAAMNGEYAGWHYAGETAPPDGLPDTTAAWRHEATDIPDPDW